MTEGNQEQNGSSEMDVIKKRIIRQIEFYFGDYNLMKDKFMLEKMKEDDGWFSMDLMMQFKRLASICSEPTTVLEALENADKSLLEIDSANKRIRRQPDRPVPQDNEEFRAKFNARTVFVKGFQSEENIDKIHEFMSEHGKIDGIYLQRLSDGKFKGSIFVTFFDKADADKFIIAPMVYYKSSELSKMSRSAYYQQLDEEKKKKKTQKMQQNQSEQAAGKPTIVVKVTGITDDTIIHTDIKNVFESKGVKNIRFFDRYQKNASDGYMIFEQEGTADDLLKVLGTDTKVTIKSAEVEFSNPSDEERVKILNMYLEARDKYFGNRWNKDRHHGGKQRKKHMKQKRPMGKKTKLDSDDEGGDAAEPAEKVAKTE